jgi:hypothetical protein
LARASSGIVAAVKVASPIPTQLGRGWVPFASVLVASIEM